MKIAIVLCFSLLCSILSGKSENVENESTVTDGISKASETDQILQALEKLENKVKNFAKSAVRFGLPFFMRIAEEANLSHSCTKTGIQFLRDILQLKPWTLRLLDSLGKPSSGLLNGVTWIRGDYDQCLKIENPINRKNEKIHGRYCVITIELKFFKKEILEVFSTNDNNTLIRLVKDILKPMQLSNILSSKYFRIFEGRFDVCLPSTCTEDDLNDIIKLVIGTQPVINVRVNFCTTNERKIKFATADIVSIIFFSVFFGLVALATTIDVMRRLNIISNNESNFLKNIIPISAFTSGKKLFSDTLWKRSACLCGIKTLIIYSIVFAHITGYSIEMLTVSENIRNIPEMFDYFPQEISNNGRTMIEAFFFISGFLTLYLKKNEDRLWFPQILILLKRIIGMTIPVLCTLATAVILSLLSDGPHSHVFIRSVNNSIENWWQYVFHLYNLLEYKYQITTHVWFINVLVQLIIFTSPFLFILNRWPKYGKVFLIVMILAGFTSYATVISIKKNFTMFGYSFRADQDSSYLADIYVKPFYSHLSSYCFGLLIGSVVGSKKQLTFRKGVIAFLWIVAAVLLGLAIFGLHGYIKEEFPNENVLLLHKIFSPYAWTVGIAWICIACITGNGGVVNWFLSLKFFVVFDRLNVWIYLLHPLLIYYTLAQLRTTHYISEINTWMLFVFIMFFTVIASVVVYIFLQTPLAFLINKLFGESCLKKPSKEVYNLDSVSTKKSAENQYI